MTDRVAVIVPAHSWPQYIGRALESVLRQNVSVDEMIVVLDAPGDLGPYEDIIHNGNLDVVMHECNLGPSAARNTGMARATEKGCNWVFFLDEDDELHPDFVRRMWQSVKLCPWLGVHYPDWVKRGDWHGYERSPEYTYELLLSRPFIVSSSFIYTPAWMMVRNKNGTGYDPGLRGWEDYLFFLEAGALKVGMGRVGLGLLYYWRHDGQSISDEVHSGLEERVSYIRDKLRRLYGVNFAYRPPNS